MLNKTITDFKQYLAATGLKQYEAAEQLGIEKGHLNRILTGKRNLTSQMAVDMRRLMGEKDILSLEECMEKYPIGSFFVNFEFILDFLFIILYYISIKIYFKGILDEKV